MNTFHTNFNILGKHSDFESWQKAESSSPVKQRKRGKQEEGEAKRVGLANYISLLKNTMNGTNKL